MTKTELIAVAETLGIENAESLTKAKLKAAIEEAKGEAL
ncbi:MAG: Rho termination factor N-terminal domain-containing protein [Bacteroides sp.]|nr:Rho termination factor N-terminal domain-containing protein [Eubacterium sp.]MCM1419299.1 Rho termination factor N-terminal domain-containing protein [Roseburia sp.]MCM1463413.1 Rho termination factor N-terminal domain-containing protein [Bacteroides sp.]